EESGCRDLAFRSDGQVFAVAHSNGVTIWDCATHTRLRRVEYPAGGVATATVVSPDGKRLFTAANPVPYAHRPEPTGPRLIQVSDPATGKPLGQWAGPRDDLRTLAISPDGKMLAGGAQDRTVHLWDTATGRELARWEAHENSVTALAFSPDGM